jgi:hypothetical protein
MPRSAASVSFPSANDRPPLRFNQSPIIVRGEQRVEQLSNAAVTPPHYPANIKKRRVPLDLSRPAPSPSHSTHVRDIFTTAARRLDSTSSLSTRIASAKKLRESRQLWSPQRTNDDTLALPPLVRSNTTSNTQEQQSSLSYPILPRSHSDRKGLLFGRSHSIDENTIDNITPSAWLCGLLPYQPTTPPGIGFLCPDSGKEDQSPSQSSEANPSDDDDNDEGAGYQLSPDVSVTRKGRERRNEFQPLERGLCAVYRQNKSLEEGQE